METYEQALSYIHTRSRVGSQVSVNRMKELMQRLNNPQDGLNVVHIAGTNGKGSVTAMTAEILQRSGYRVGRYVSPFILDFRERMMVNGEMISEEMLVELVNLVYPAVSAMENEGVAPTEFETVTAIAFCYFAKMECEVVCLEVGLGGKADSTNIVKAPLCCAITSIGLDHTAILGNTLEQIALEKAGILKPECSVVCGADIPPEALGVIYEQAAKTRSTVIYPNRQQMVLQRLSLSGTDFIYAGERYHTALIGVHQVTNTVTVLEICKVLQSKGIFISRNAIAEGLRAVNVPARMQVLQNNPMVVLDGGHNPQGILALVSSLKELGVSRAHIVVGMMKDKDCAAAARLLCEIAASVRCVTVNDMPRVCPAKELAEIFTECGAAASAYASLPEAILAAKADCRSDESVLICGSLYLAERVLNELN